MLAQEKKKRNEELPSFKPKLMSKPNAKPVYNTLSIAERNEQWLRQK